MLTDRLAIEYVLRGTKVGGAFVRITRHGHQTTRNIDQFQALVQTEIEVRVAKVEGGYNIDKNRIFEAAEYDVALTIWMESLGYDCLRSKRTERSDDN